MEVKINIQGKDRTLLLGYSALKALAMVQIEYTTDEEQTIFGIEKGGYEGFVQGAKKEGIETPTREEFLSWLEDIDVYLEVKKAVEGFSTNFGMRVLEMQKEFKAKYAKPLKLQSK